MGGQLDGQCLREWAVGTDAVIDTILGIIWWVGCGGGRRSGQEPPPLQTGQHSGELTANCN